MAKNLCNMWLKICEICVLSFQPRKCTSTKDYVRKNKLFMQNKAKFQKVKLNVNNVSTKDYDQMDTWSIGKNEPKRTQNEPKRTQIQSQLKPIKCQNKAKTNPKRTQSNPNLVRHQCGGSNVTLQKWVITS